MPLPSFLVIGETKCGTTSLFDNLVQNPKILTPRGNGENIRTKDNSELGKKEIRFFDKKWHKGINWYKSCFYHTGTMYITGEASPTYLYRTQALDRIKKTCPNIKLIVSLRNPVDRLNSHFFHMGRIVSDWFEKYPTLEDFWNSALEQDYYLIEKGLYHRSVGNLLEHFKYSQCLFIRSEDMFAEPDETMNSVFSFLGVPQVKITPRHSRSNSCPKIPEQLREEIFDFYQGSIYRLENLLNRKMDWNV